MLKTCMFTKYGKKDWLSEVMDQTILEIGMMAYKCTGLSFISILAVALPENLAIVSRGFYFLDITFSSYKMKRQDEAIF